MMGNYRELHAFLGQNPQAQLLILDNNNIQFCFQHEKYFPLEEIYKVYDLVLVPQWVHDEVANSDSRLSYLARLPKDLLIIDEELDFLPLVAAHGSFLTAYGRELAVVVKFLIIGLLNIMKMDLI